VIEGRAFGCERGGSGFVVGVAGVNCKRFVKTSSELYNELLQIGSFGTFKNSCDCQL
jgi:hypothetical protein